MGTRGAVGYRVDGRNVIYYNHFDSYPDSLGIEVVDFCKELTKMDLDLVKERVRAVKLITRSEEIPTQEEIELYKDVADLGVSNRSLTDWYCLLRNFQHAAGLRAIALGQQFHVVDGQEFIKESLWCEYAYIIDLDKMEVEFYRGFQRKPQDGNPFGTESDSQNEFYPCKLIACYPIGNISPNWKADFRHEDEERYKGEKEE